MFRTSSAPKLMTLAAAFSLLAACGPKDAGVQGVLPNDDAVSIRVPGAQQQSGSQASQALVGESSEFYVHTYRISRFLNGHVIGLLHMIREIASNEPTTVDGNKATWGPHTPGGLEPLTYRMTAEKLGENLYAIDLQGRPKNSLEESDYKSLIDGQLQGSGADDGRGKGTLVLHFDNAGAMNPAVLERGEIQIAFDALDEPRWITVDFVQFQGADASEPGDATYRYEENEDRSGSFLFSIKGNVHKQQENRPGLEEMTLRSRWLSSGAGRGDVTVSGEEVAAQLAEHAIEATQVQATECWGADFAVVFQDTRPEELREEIRPLEGDATECAFAEAAFPEQL